MKKFLFLFIFLSPAVFAAECKTERKVFIENADTKVWKTTLCPRARLPLHSHDYARVIISEETATLKAIYQSGKEIRIELKKKIPAFLSLAQGKEPHEDENLSDQTLHLTLIELKHG